MGKRATGGSAEESADTVQSLPTTNGSQLSLFPWLRELSGNTECFEADEAYFLNTGSWVNNAGKAVFYSPQHAVLAIAGLALFHRRSSASTNHHQLMVTPNFTLKNWLR